MKSVWGQLATVDTQLDTLRETPWTAVVPKKVRQKIDGELLESLKVLVSLVTCCICWIFIMVAETP